MTEEIKKAILIGNRYDIGDILEETLKTGTAPMACLDAMMAGLDETGTLFDSGEYFVPELMMAADTFNAGMEILSPLLADKPRSFKGTIVLGTVQGDVHDIGKNLVGFMLESSGFKVIDLGTNVPAESFMDAVTTHSADILAISALLTTTMLSMESVVEQLENSGLRSKVKVIIGGAPVSEQFAIDIKADAYAMNAPQGIEIVKAWLGD